MNRLLHEVAPIPERAWEAIETEVGRILRLALAARRIVDFAGPVGEEQAAVSTGRLADAELSTTEGVTARRRDVLPLIEAEARFTLSREVLDVLARGAEDADLGTAVAAAQRLAAFEERTVFHGLPDSGIHGLVGCSAHRPIPIAEDDSNWTAVVVEATERLRSAGVGGPYALAVGPRGYAGLLRASDPEGYPVLERLTRLVAGPIVRAVALDGAVVVSRRGGDFELTVGQDAAVGFVGADVDAARLRILESFAFRTLTPEAAVPLTRAG